MRITNSMMVSQFLYDANTSLSRLAETQEQVDTTRRVTSISDDPQATITALRARNKLSGFKTYQDNIKTATTYLTEAESSVNELNEILQKVYEEVVQAIGVDNEDDLSVIAEELESLQEEIVSIGNTTIGSTYLFGGYNFTGTADATGSTTAPFSVDNGTGHLIYNGIDLTKVSCSADYDSRTGLMSDCRDTIQEAVSDLTSTYSDEYARDTICAQALESLEALISNGDAALSAAEESGVDTSTSTGYQELSDFMHALSDLADEFTRECSKELAGDYILESDSTIQLTDDGEIDYDYYEKNGITVMTDEEYANCFSISNAQGILNEVTELLGNTDTTVGVGLDYDMDTAISDLASDVTVSADIQAAIADEADNQAVLQIGSTQTVEYTFSGLDLLGTGTENVYYILDRCITLLKNGDTDGLSNMISEIQDTQSAALTLETKIGTKENRLEMISTRYESSKANYTEMQSNAVDIDMAEAITNYTTAQTVYSAALAAGAEIIQTSLLDFIS